MRIDPGVRREDSEPVTCGERRSGDVNAVVRCCSSCWPRRVLLERPFTALFVPIWPRHTQLSNLCLSGSRTTTRSVTDSQRRLMLHECTLNITCIRFVYYYPWEETAVCATSAWRRVWSPRSPAPLCGRCTDTNINTYSIEHDRQNECCK